MKRKKHTLLCLLLAAAFVSGCAQKHKEGEPDVISSMKMNQDETLTVVANRKQIEDKEDFAKLLVKKCKDNSFSSLFLHRSSPFFYFLLSESSFQKSNTVKIS